MLEIEGRLVEMERREIEPTMVYYKPVWEPLGALASFTDVAMDTPQQKREVWLAKSCPVTKDDFAIFMLDRIE